MLTKNLEAEVNRQKRNFDLSEKSLVIAVNYLGQQLIYDIVGREVKSFCGITIEMVPSLEVIKSPVIVVVPFAILN